MYISAFLRVMRARATSKGIDGFFIEGSLRGKSVNVKLYGKKENILDISTGEIADYYLVLTGDEGARARITTLKPQWNKTTLKVLQKKSGYSGKYVRIGEYLSGLYSDSITFSFDELEKILGFSLPSSAHNHPAWWANSGHDHSRAWSDYGWLVNGISLGEWVRFRKEEP